MFAHRATQGLVWKESRQLLPLIGIVLVGGLVVITMLQIASALTPGLESMAPTILWTLPACYAAGVGAMLVSQEKEQNTISWLAALPTEPARLVQAKLIVAVGGLAVMWLITGCGSLLIASSPSSPIANYSIFLSSTFGPTFVAQSLFILVCGFYSAWRFESTFVGLLVLIPIACVPFMFYTLIELIYTQSTGMRTLQNPAATIVSLVGTILWTIVFGAMAIRVAARRLAPVNAASEKPSRLSASLEPWRPVIAPPVPTAPFQNFLGSFLWQTSQTQRWARRAMAIVLIAGAYALATVVTLEHNFFAVARTMLIAAAGLVVSWLGVMSFAGDGAAARMRFLAERGVAPWQAWLGRHVANLGVLSFAMLSYLIFSWQFASTKSVDQIAQSPSVAMLLILVWTTYGLSQWISQSIPILAGSVILAPLACLLVIGWGVSAITSLEAPLWLLLACSVLPMLASLLAMRRYMDGHRNWTTVAFPLATAIVIFAVPTFPLLIRIVNTPDVSADRLALMETAADGLDRTAVTPVYAKSVHESELFVTPAQRIEKYERAMFGPNHTFVIPWDGGDESVALTMDWSVGHLISQAATYAEVRYRLAPGDDGNAVDLRTWMEEIAHLAWRLRLSQNQYDQSTADIYEIWLTRTLGDPLVQMIPELQLAPFIKLLGGHERRSRGRRNAVLRSWKMTRADLEEQVAQRSRLFFGGTEIPAFQSIPATRFQITHQRYMNRLADVLLRFIDAGEDQSQTIEIRRELNSIVNGPNAEFESSLYSESQPETHLNALGIYPHVHVLPGALWYRPWEQRAKDLAMSLTDLTSHPYPAGSENE